VVANPFSGAKRNPQRVATLTGVAPHRSGVYGNQEDWRIVPALSGVTPLPQHLRLNGYWTGGAGKIYHANLWSSGGTEEQARAGFSHPDSWDEAYPSREIQIPVPEQPLGENFSGLGSRIADWDWAALDVPDEQTIDGRVTTWAAQQLHRTHKKPFFLAVGIYKPHNPLYAPRKYFDMHPLDRVQLPAVREDDLDDLPPHVRPNPAAEHNPHRLILERGLWRQAVQAYLANSTFADAMIGRLIEALDASGSADNTIIVLWSDHGYHLGEKQRWHKTTLWEDATRVPMIVIAPGVTKAGGVCNRPVSLLDIYPTLLELCGVPAPAHELDGRSLVGLLRDPAAQRSEPAIITNFEGNHAVRSEHWRYIRYKNGAQELYDHRTDPHEWTNLAADPKYAEVIAEHAKWLP
jgi:arylsulfatase A-like enzyme